MRKDYNYVRHMPELIPRNAQQTGDAGSSERKGKQCTEKVQHAMQRLTFKASAHICTAGKRCREVSMGPKCAPSLTSGPRARTQVPSTLPKTTHSM
eukprot:397580-Pelagomonas_calceolata.AAC.7